MRFALFLRIIDITLLSDIIHTKVYMYVKKFNFLLYAEKKDTSRVMRLRKGVVAYVLFSQVDSCLSFAFRGVVALL